MAEQRKTIRETEETTEGEQEYEQEIISNLPAKLSDQILQAWEDDNISLTVSRRLKNGRKTAFLFEIDEYEDLPSLMSHLRDEYGGGSFLIEGRRSNGSWALKQAIDIEPPKTKKEEYAQQQQGSEISSLIMAMNESNRQQSDLMREQMQQMQSTMMQAQIDSAKNQSEMLMKMMEINATNKPESTGIKDILEMVTLMKSLEGDKSDPMEMLLKGMEMGKELGSGGDDNILQTALKTLGGPLVNMAEQMKQSPQQFPSQNPPEQLGHNPAPQNAPEQPQQNQPSEQQAQEAEDMKQFLPVFNSIIEQAAKNAPVDPVVDFAIDKLPDHILESYIVNEQVYNQLYQMQPMLTPYKEWLDKFREGVLKWYHGEGEPDNVDDTATDVHGSDNSTAPIPGNSAPGDPKRPDPH